MQMLLDQSEEFGVTAGLGLIPGRVVPVASTTAAGDPQKIPHIGWNALVLPERCAGWDGTVLRCVRPGEAVYFVHSFMANPDNPEHRVADCLYGGQPISAVIARGNVLGCQFHPEKSGGVGLKILRTFLEAPKLS
jgi:glutamine amidotransferase